MKLGKLVAMKRGSEKNWSTVQACQAETASSATTNAV
jgi:hypothetical protein